MPDPVALVVEPRRRDIGGLPVQRLLPVREARAVGPFVFLDRRGPLDVQPGQDVDVLPHPHIGLATVTWLFEGAMTHRDSLGAVQEIVPGNVNWMTAGRGVVHSERRPARLAGVPYRLHGLQAWAALPRADETCEPSFAHHGAGELPAVREGGAMATVVAGEAFGLRSPVSVLSPLVYADLSFGSAGAAIESAAAGVPHPELALFLAAGSFFLGAGAFEAPLLVVLAPFAPWRLEARTQGRAVLLGGEPLDGPRHVSWNFVSSSTARIEEARRAWRERAFPHIPGETGFVPLPEG